MAVTTVDSGSKALEFLGLHENDPNTPFVSPNGHQVWFLFFFFLFSVSPNSDLKSFLRISLHFPFCFSKSFFFHFMNLQEMEVNLIITDYCMPGMTGYDLLKKIKV